MTKSCQNCQESFQIKTSDLKFLEKIALKINGEKIPIPQPTHCPLCRQQRRFAFRNERHLYRRKCNGSGKEIISMYPEGSPYKIYAQDVWWQGNWDATNYGRDFDFNRPFFEQFHELMKDTPRIALLNVNGENSDYCNFTGDVKNSYLIFGSVYSEDCYYGSPYYSKDCVDTLVLRNCELCYECIDCRHLYNSLYCQDCNNSDNLLFCFDLQGCSECIGCSGLRRKKYCFFNEQLSKEEYEKAKANIDLCNPAHIKKLQDGLERIKLKVPHRAMQSMKVENVSGDYVFNSKNTQESFFADQCEDCSYCAQVVDLKDCYDNNYTEENELCYEYLGMYGTRETSFSIFCRHTSQTLYSDYCVSCSCIFGCTNLRNKEYCILNKQYSKKEYEELLPKIIRHMQNTGEWGEFFPIQISPFAYNETVAQEYFPLSKEKSEERGWQWKEADKKEYQRQTIEVPQNIEAVSDDICYEILSCEITGRNFRIIPQELNFYRRMKLPIPRKHPDQRHLERISKRNPRKLFQRNCSKCQKQVRSSYPPNSPYSILCSACYLETIE